MRIAIYASESDASQTSPTSNQISEMCDYVRADQGASLLIPQPGKLMDLIKILKEHDVAYHVQDLQSSCREGYKYQTSGTKLK